MKTATRSILSPLKCALRLLAFALAGLGDLPLARGEAVFASGNFMVSQWQVEDGLPDNRVTAITQTKDGYLWLGTYAGLVRFDGVKFTVFDARTTGLPSDRIVSLFGDRAGGLWFGTENGELARYAADKFTVFGETQGWKEIRVARFAEDGDRLLMGTRDCGLIEFKNGRFARLIEDGKLTGRSNLAVNSGSSGAIWVRTPQGLKTFVSGAWGLRPMAGVTPSQIEGIAPARGGGVWVCAGGKLQWFSGSEAVVRGSTAWRGPAEITSLLEDSSGGVWLTTWGQGLLYYPTNAAPSSFAESDGAPSFLTCVFEDRELNIWVGAGGQGLLRFKPRVFHSHTPQPPDPPYRCNALAANPAGGLWVGTAGQGLVQWNDGRFSAPIKLAGQTSDAFFAATVERSGRLWVGSYYAGVFSKDGERSFHWSVQEGLLDNRVYALAVARDGTLWVGTDKGVSRRADDRFENFTVREGLPAGTVRAIVQDAAGGMWFGFSAGGLARWRDGRFETFAHPSELGRNRVRCLRADDDGTVWIGTEEDGLLRWRAGQFKNFRVEDDFPRSQIAAIVDDGLGFLWLSTGHGVIRVARAQLEAFSRGDASRIEWTRYLKNDGLASVQCADGSEAAVRTSDGRLWFATQKGLSVVNPRELKLNTVPPPVLIEQVFIDGKTPELPAAATLIVPAGRRRLEIHYTGLSLTAPERVRFKQRLEGFDTEWQDVGEQRFATFQGLRPGNYRFHVTARNGDGVWNNDGASLAFIVQPELWQTAWFRGAVVLGLAAIVFGIFRARISRLQQRQAVQLEFSRGLIASQEAERKRIAAELHDSLGQNLLVIKSRLRMAQRAAAGHSPELDEITKLAAQSLEEVREISQNLRPYQLDRLGLTQALHGLVKKVGESLDLKCTADITPVDRVFSSEAEMNLFRIVQEALNNVLKHSGATEARIEVSRDDRNVRVSVTDNGHGFDPALKQNDAGRGMGLSGMAERARILNGHLTIDSAPGQGTTLTIVVPIPKEKP